MRNIGISFVKLGQFQDAITSFENIVEANSDYHAAFNLVICYFALGDRERMRRGFQKLVQIRPLVVEQFEDAMMHAMDDSADLGGGNVEDHEVFNHDSLRGVARERYSLTTNSLRKRVSERYILLAAKLVALNGSESGRLSSVAISDQGYDWVVQAIKASPHAEISFELEIAKAVQYLKTREFSKAIEALKSFEKQDQKLVGTGISILLYQSCDQFIFPLYFGR
jgi:intraflagellar transport protein 88